MTNTWKSLSDSIIHRLAAGVLAIAVGVAAAACSATGSTGSSAVVSTASISSVSVMPATSAPDPTQPSTTRPTASFRTTHPTTAAAAPSKTELAAMVLQPGDFGVGWKASAPAATDSADDDAATARTAACVGGRNTAPDRVAHADSRQFTRGGLTLSSSADSYRTAADVAADTAVLTSPKIERCLAASFRTLVGAQLPAGAKITGLRVQVVPGAGCGPRGVIATGSGQITLEAGGKTFLMYLAVVDIAGPLREAEVDAQSFGAPIAPSTLVPLVKAVAARVGG